MNGQVQAGTYLLYRALHPRHLGAKTGVPEGDWMRFSDAPPGYWATKVRKVGAVSGDAIDHATNEFIARSPEPLLALISHKYASVPSGLGLGGVRSLAVELFGKREDPSPDTIRDVAVSDNHLHSGLAYDRRSLLTALVRRPQPIISIHDGFEGIPSREIVLASAIRWSIRLLENMVDQQSWDLSSFASGRAGLADACHLVESETFWPTIRTLTTGITLFDGAKSTIRTFINQIWQVDDDRFSADCLKSTLSRWDGSNTRAPELVCDLIRKLSILDCCPRMDERFPAGTEVPAWPYAFVLNMIRASVELFGEVPSWPGEGFTRFQSHCGDATSLRKIIFGGATSDKLEMAAQSTSIVESMRGYPAPYFLDSFELRREVDPGLEEEAMVKDILKGIVKRWKTYSEVVSLSCDAGGRMLKRFCAPVSFQRPKWDWKRGHSQAGVYTSRIEGRRFRSRRCADPWEQVHYVASVVRALRSARMAYGEADFDRAVGSLDVSGIEIAHATWPYVAAINLLLEGGWSLSFTAHAGESFERSSTGIRTIGQLFLGQFVPGRIGHASALDERMRRMISKQQIHNVGSSEPYRFDDYLQDLCFVSIVRSCSGLENRVGQQLLQELTKGAGWSISAETWVEAFKWLHSSAPVAFAEQKLNEQEWHNLEDAETVWRTLSMNGDLDLKHAIQQFIFGKVIDRDMAARTPCCASGGLPLELENRLVSFLESQTIELKDWVLDRIVSTDALVECCPTSNLALAGVRDYEDHPIWDFIRSRVRVSVNSDDPLVFGGFGGEELSALYAGYGSDTASLHSSLSDLSSKANAHAVVQEVDVNFLSRTTSLKIS